MTAAAAVTASGVQGSTALAVWSLCRRELVRFVRQRSRIVAALGTPLLMWVLLGAGLHGSFQTPAAPGGAAGAGIGSVASAGADAAGAGAGSYLAYFFPGALLLVVLFTAIFSTISIIEDRHAGFLQAVLVAPVPRGSIVLGKVLGGTILATGQGALFLLLAPLAGLRFGPVDAAAALLLMFILSFALTGLGFLIAWRMDSVSGFHGVMNLLLMPMWILSGAAFPASGAHAWLKFVLYCNPLSYGLDALRRTLGGVATLQVHAAAEWAVALLFAAAMYAAAAAMMRASAEAGT